VLLAPGVLRRRAPADRAGLPARRGQGRIAYPTGLYVPPFDCAAEHAVSPTISRSSARSAIASPRRARGGRTVRAPSESTSTRMNALNAVGIASGAIPY